MKEFFNCAMNIGEQMLISGAEVHRAEESVKLMCKHFGAQRVDVFIITSSMVATIYTDKGESFTETRRIGAINNDFEKLHRLNKLSRKICSEELTVDQIRTEFEKAISCKTYPFIVDCAFYSIIAAAFTLFFGGDFAQALISFFIGATVRIGILFSEKTIGNNIFAKFFAMVIASTLSFTALKIGLVSSVDKLIIGNIMTLIPGVGLTNALRDLFAGDSIAGILRTISAVLTALAIAAGYFLVAVLGGFVL